MKTRLQMWPQLPAAMAGALGCELTRGLTIFLEPGQIFVGGQPIRQLDYLLQNILGLVRGVATLGVPFGLVAWIVLSLAIHRTAWWRDYPLIFMLVAGWMIIVTPMYQVPFALQLAGPYMVFAAGVVLCRTLARIKGPAHSSTLQKDAGHVEHDLLCAKCQYNLRTLPLNGQCSECGFAIGETIYLRTMMPRPHSFWRFFPFSLCLMLTVMLTFLTIEDLHLRFRNSYPLKEGLWGNKWLFLIAYQTGVIAAVSTVLAWPVLWLSLRRKRLLPSFILLFAVMTASSVLTLGMERFPTEPFVGLALACALCAFTNLFNLRPDLQTTALPYRAATAG